MSTPARFRLYQTPQSPYCIPVELMLRHSGLAYEVVNLPVGDPSEVIRLTEGAYYQVPVLEDLQTRQKIFERSAEGDEVARHIAEAAPLLKLFPAEVAGLHRILVHYIENDCEAVGFKICDAHRDKWLKNDLERGLHRRHKERKFGPGCLEQWTRNVDGMVEEFYRLILPFEQMLAHKPFLTGEHPVFADYALCGVLGNFLFAGTTSLPANYLMLEAWYTRMRAGNFRGPMDDLHLGSDGESADDSLEAPDMTEIFKAIDALKLRPGTQTLDVGTGLGHIALALAERGFSVTGSDASAEHVQAATKLAAEKQAAVVYHEHTAEHLPYADNSFGLITCHLAAHHFVGPELFVRECARVLKTYGYLVIVDVTVPDDQAEAQSWMSTIQRLRAPDHHVRFITPNVWRKWCVDVGLTVTHLQIKSVRQPDLNAYFEHMKTPADNRKKVLEMFAKAPPSVRELFKIGQEDGKLVWFKRQLTLVAGKI